MIPSDTRPFATAMRLSALRMVQAAAASHIGSCLSMADILAVLYGTVMRHKPEDPKWQGRDRLLVSKGHAAAIVYAALAEQNYFDKAQLASFCQNGSPLMGHLNHHVPGIELSTGSLGHALPVACGMALANKPNRHFVILSDGEMDEGSNWEAMLFAGHHKLTNLTTIVDYNKIQSYGSVKDVLDLEPLADKWRSCRWQVHELDGHDHDALKAALLQQADAPTVIIAHTVKGKGVSFMENKLEWHYKSPSAEQLAQAISELSA